MAQPIPVKVLDVCRVAPTTTTLPNLAAQTSLPLTFFDVFWLRFPPTQRLFFYESPHPITTLSDTILPKLKLSLSVTLGQYIPFAGNLTWPQDSGKPIIQYSDGDAVSLTVAESEANSFHSLSGNDFRDAKKFHNFLPDLLSFETKVPVMAWQVTLFPNAGFSIGYSAHHAVFDGKSVAMFLHSWASICKGGGNSTLTHEPLFDRTIINDPSGIEKAYLNAWLQHNGPNNKSLMIWEMKAPLDAMFGTFQLTQANIQSLKKWVKVQWEGKHKEIKPTFHASTFVIATAYTWVCLVRTRKLATEYVRLGFSVDCRARLEPQLPPNYFGNCIVGCSVDATTNELMGEDGFGIAVREIADAIVRLDDGVLIGAEDMISNLFALQKEEVSLLTMAGSPRFEFYNTDFGWGRPKKVEMVSIEKSGAFSLSDTRDGNGGVEIGVVLKKHETEVFASLFANGLQYYQSP